MNGDDRVVGRGSAKPRVALEDVPYPALAEWARRVRNGDIRREAAEERERQAARKERRKD